MNVDYYKPTYHQEVTPYSYVETIESTLAGHESLQAGLYIIEECLNRWQAMQFSKLILEDCMNEYLTKECCTDLINLAFDIQGIQHSPSPFDKLHNSQNHDEEIENIDCWEQELEPIPAQADNSITKNRQIIVKYIATNNEDASQIDNQSEKQLLDMLNTSKLSMTSGSTIKQSTKHQSPKLQPFKKLNLSLISKSNNSILKQGFNTSRGNLKDKSSNVISIRDQSNILTQLQNRQQNSSLNLTQNQNNFQDGFTFFNPKPMKLELTSQNETKDMTKIQITSKEVDDLIEWQRSKKVRDEIKKQQLSEMLHQQIIDDQKAANIQINPDKQKFTFTSSGKLLLINENDVKSADNPLNLDSARVQKIHQVQVIKKGVEETKSKVIVDKKPLIPLGQKKKKDEIDFTEPMQNINEIMNPGDGVIFQDSKNRLKIGQSIKEILAKQNKITRSQYLEMTRYKEFSFGNVNSTLFDTENQTSSLLNTQDLDPMLTSSQNLKFGFGYNPQKSRNPEKYNGKIHRSVNLNEISQLLTDENLNTKTQDQNQHFLQLSKKRGSLSSLQQNNFFEKSFAGQSNLGFLSERRHSENRKEQDQSQMILPEIPKYQSKKKLASLFKSMSQNKLMINYQEKHEFDLPKEHQHNLSLFNDQPLTDRNHYNANKLPSLAFKDTLQYSTKNRNAYNRQAFIDKIQDQTLSSKHLNTTRNYRTQLYNESQTQNDQFDNQQLQNSSIAQSISKLMKTPGFILGKRVPPKLIAINKRYNNDSKTRDLPSFMQD
eukprot:403335758